jgi:dTDP-4-dehydrorhamnose reductase
MKILLTGAAGQLGRSLRETAPDGCDLVPLEHNQLDITDAQAVAAAAHRAAPDVVINAAAYTAVDKAESESELAFAVNATGAENLARAAKETGARLIHLSTDFVFDGTQGTPYRLDDRPNPLCVYGASKAEGEKCIQNILGEQALIVRTSWVYAKEGGNFVNTMLRLMQTKPALNVVSDQVGTPTWAVSLAHFLWTATKYPSINGIHHYSDAGVASWYDFAVAIQDEACAAGALNKVVPITPITSEEYPQAARRPAYSVLDKRCSVRGFGCQPIYWRANLRRMLSGK